MSKKIERRRATVTLYQGNYEAELADLMERAMAAQRAENTSVRRFGEKSESMALAAEYDALLAKAEEDAVKVTVWAISNNEWQPLADEHQPREDDAKDATFGVNMSTFPAVLLRASLVAPGETGDGEKILAELGDISRVHYLKLETAAWNVNVGSDALPKFSLVSLMTEAKEPDSKPQLDSE